MSRPVYLAAGGTGGHMFPARALAAELRSKGCDALIVCDRRGARFVDPSEPHQRVAAASPSGSRIQQVRATLLLMLGVLQCIGLCLRQRPAAVVCFGGYAAVPAWIAARLLRIAVVVHEQNGVLGRTNRRAAASARLLALTFADTRHVPAGLAAKTKVTGNPVREPVLKLSAAGYQRPLPDERVRLLVVGGSQGARSLSDALPAAIAALPETTRRRLDLMQQCRPEDLDRVDAAYRRIGFRAELAAFFDDLPERLASSHLVISRSGASSVAELLVLGRPSILVPYRHAADDHQRANAEVLVAEGAAWMLSEDELQPQRLAALLRRLIAAPDVLDRAAARARELARPDAAAALAGAVMPLAGGIARRSREALA